MGEFTPISLQGTDFDIRIMGEKYKNYYLTIQNMGGKHYG